MVLQNCMCPSIFIRKYFVHVSLKIIRLLLERVYCILHSTFHGYPFNSKFRLFVCVCLEFFVPLENFSLKWRRHHSWWRATNFYVTRPSWPLSSEGTLACHTYCDTGQPLIKFRNRHSTSPIHSQS